MTEDADGVLDYGADYYRNHCGPIPYDRSNPHWSVFFGGIADTLIRSFQPTKVFDVGCALGFLVEAFWDRGVEAWGRDISAFAISQVRADMRTFCTVGSATAPIEERYDLITCIEVLEHMPEEEAIRAIKAMAQATHRILFSSSPTDAEEPTHINVKPTMYWLSLFGAEGFSPLMSYDPTFVTPHCVVFERFPEQPSLATLLGYAEIVRLRLQQTSRDQTIRDLYGSLDRGHKIIADATQERAQLKASLDAATAQISTLTSRLDAAEAENRAKLEVVKQTRVTIEAQIRLQAETTLQRNKIVEELDSAYRQIAIMEDEVASKHNELERVVGSIAWRATWPVRKVGRMLPPSVRTMVRRILIAIWWALTFQLVSRLRQRRQSITITEGNEPPLGEPAPALSHQDACEEHSDERLSAEEFEADQLPWMRILRIVVTPDLAWRPRLNVLIPGLAMKHMSGGPNTALNVACRLARTGVAVRLVAMSAPLDPDPAAFWAHAAAMSGADPAALGIELVDASAGDFLEIGENDLFMATAWWTAQAAKYAVRHTKQKRFVYLIQDYEPLLHPASTQQALADETYTLDHIPIINTSLLREFFIENKIGRFADTEFAAKALAFEPAIDSTLFYSAALRAPDRRKRLLFYARPQNGLRNLFELGVAALRVLIAQRNIDNEEWEFCGMGETFTPVDLGSGCTLQPLSWKNLTTYAEQMRDSDVLLSCMLSPHPSYPPLEMAACGGLVVTTTFHNKTAERLHTISPNIIGVEPTLDGIVSGLRQAMLGEPGQAGVALPKTWSESLDGVIQTLRDRLIRLEDLPAHAFIFDGGANRTVFPGFDFWPTDQYGMYRRAMVADRAADYRDADASLVSFITPAWNTAPKFLFELAETVFGQDCAIDFEWVIVDNGSSDDQSRAALATIAERPNVKLIRVEKNIGIVPALRMALEHASNRYVFPLDSDDLLTPDCLRIMTSALRAANLPKLAYSDEDMVLEGHPRNPYSKPDWDPVLFTHSCYIAHLCAIDREAAIALGCYTDVGAQGSSDWDSFTRFLVAGHTPLHVPEIIYTWRMHQLSTSMNIGSKDYIHDSQRTVLHRFLSSRAPSGRYSLELSPIFNGTPDWRFVRAVNASSPITTLLYGVGPVTAGPQFANGRVVRLETLALPNLLLLAREAAAAGRYIHLLSAEVSIEDQSWIDEAMTLCELFTDVVIVGGRIHQDGTIVAADSYFGFDGPCGSPNIGRSIADPGYFAHLFKPHSSDAVPLQHCFLNASFLADVLPELIAIDVEVDDLAMWLGAIARRNGQRCVYSPFFIGSTQKTLPQFSSGGLAALALRYADLIPEKALLSPRLGLTRDTVYQPVLRSIRAAQEASLRQRPALPYAELHKAELQARHVSGPIAGSTDISVLTTVYSRTEAELFRETAATLMAQTTPFREWVILAHGPITPALETVLLDLSADPRVKLLRRDVNLGIVGGMRLCLEAATQRLVLPLDADDLLTKDALGLIVTPFQNSVPAILSYSDEDILQAGRLQSPIRRTEFDPILNDADSTIWHLCAFDRQAALRLGIYTDPETEFCHDWDTVHRFADAGEPIAHVPHVLYHWRHHEASTSTSGSVNTGSIRSVRHVLSRMKERLSSPDLYEIQTYPLYRGAEQLALMRQHSSPLPICLIYFSREAEAIPDLVTKMLPVAKAQLMKVDGTNLSARLTEFVDSTACSHAVLLQEGLTPCNEDGVWDAMRLFEMHRDVAACAGRILNREDRVIASCETAASGHDGWVGRTRMEPGESAMALKPQTAMRLADGYVFCTVPTLSESLRAARLEGMSDVTRRIERVSAKNGLRLGYSPLIEARTSAVLETSVV